MRSNLEYSQKLTKKVYAKLSSNKESFEVESGFKEWFAGLALSFAAAVTGISEAGATAQDLDKYLDNAFSSAKKHVPELGSDDFKVWKSMTYTRSLQNGGGGGGDFKVYIGPYVLDGFYHRLGETDHGQFEFEADVDMQKGEYTKADLEKYKPAVKEFIENAKDALWKNKSKVKKDK